MTELDDEIAQRQEELECDPLEDAARAWALFNLADCLEDRLLERDDIEDIQEAIELHRTALALRPEGHADRHESFFSLARCLQKRYHKQGTLPDLEEAIMLYRAAIILDMHPTGHPDRSTSLNNLAVYLSDRYDKLAFIADLEEAITLGRAALDLRPTGHPDRSLSLDNLTAYLFLRYEKLASIADLEEAIMLGRAGLDLCPMGHPKRAGSLNNLAWCLRERYSKLASIADLEEAITLGRAALDLRPVDHPDRSTSLDNLVLYLSNRYGKLASIADLEEAITLRRATLDLCPTDHPGRWSSLNNLAWWLRERYNKLASIADLEEAITLSRTILDLHSPGHCNRAESIDNLLLHLRKRLERLDMTSDLDECIKLQCLALGLRKPGDLVHATHLRHLIADLQSMFRKLDNVSNIPDSANNTTFIRGLVVCVRGIIGEEHASTNMDEVVPVARAALKLYPLGHSDHVTLLTALATCLQHRFQRYSVIADLDQAILLHKVILEHYSPGNPDSAPPLHMLACCLSKRFIRLFIMKDLDNAIKFEQAAYKLYAPGHPDSIQSLDHLAHCRQLRLERRVAISRPDRFPVSTRNRTIEDIVFDVLKTCPPRLLNTHSGVLCDRGAQILHFKNSQEYEQLVSSMSTLDMFMPTDRIREVVSTYFRYVSLSHRWGNSEPLLRDIEKQLIYDSDPPDSLLKLSFFCLASYRCGYMWAWSDTCCIDKESSAELQEAIGSMFSWYRQSALTMVHLADVSDTEKLTSSEWFKRGWTLQELLAPHTLLFFTREWSLYRGIPSNHKEHKTILYELEQVTGITSQHLSAFRPGVNDARARLRWASTRSTTRLEDIAYSLFGVFGFHLPVLYGEGADSALGRLLAEVISRSGDTSILDWIGKPSTFHSCFPATLEPYRILPVQPLRLGFKPPSNIQTTDQSCILNVRKMHHTLSNLHLAEFANIRLFLPCIVHRVNTVRTRSDTRKATYQILAMGLDPIEITLSQPLQNTPTKAIPYVLVRPWHPNLSDVSVMDDDASAYQWFTMMQEPFSALLLEQLRQNEYRRVATSCHIVTFPSSPDGALQGEVTTLTIV